MPFVLCYYHLPYLLKGVFSSIVDSLVRENFSGGKPQDPHITIMLLVDQYTKHCFSEKEFEDENLLLWKDIHIHRCTLRENFAPQPKLRAGIPGSEDIIKCDFEIFGHF